MASGRFSVVWPIVRIATLVLLLLPSSIGQAADSATQNGSVISIPVVLVGDVAYSVELTLISGSNPPAYLLTAAAELANPDTSTAASFADNTLLIPSIQFEGASLRIELTLISDSPIQFQLAGSSENVSGASAYELFEANISSQIIDSRCSICHLEGGVAGDTGLTYLRSGEDKAQTNFDRLTAFVTSREDALDYILEKASGGLSHGGGTQLAVGSSDYLALQELLSILTTGSSGTGSEDESFFSGVELLSNEQTLRRAAIILAGRVPTDVEYAAVASGDEEALRSTVRGLMDGENFHRFLLDGANDKLLVRGIADGTFLDGGGVFPNWSQRNIELRLQDLSNGLSWSFNTGRYVNGVDRGLRESPLELIAYIAENDRPYSEILTADYMMSNPIAAWAMDATGEFNNPEDYAEFQPVTLDRYYSWSEELTIVEVTEIADWLVQDPGSLYWDYPHAGVLNTQAFLFRYPTTATNRNRARARWTYLHFLDLDIEKSAPRTTDPVALADTNNPTMFNSNCTVCHANLDPVAGSFQFYGEEGHYKVNGYDSLDNFYKYPEDWESRIYQEGDTWYRDMRAPGFGGDDASGDSSLQWLAQEIINDPAFATAAVKFWWPALIGTELVEQPEVQEDANYEAQLMAFNAQSSTVTEIAEQFRQSGMLLKDLLADLVISPWFRAVNLTSEAASEVQSRAHDIANLGSERLLTPEQLSRKTTSLTGFTLGAGYDFERDVPYSALDQGYRLYYGGIDSAGVTARAREMTALMSTVAMTHATESSCPIVLREFALADSMRKLFDGITEFQTPLTLYNEQFEIPARYQSEAGEEVVTVDVELESEPVNILVSLSNGFCDWNEETQVCDSNNYLSEASIQIRAPNGVVQDLPANDATVVLSSDCAWFTGTGIGLCNRSSARFIYTPTMSGTHQIIATLRATRDGGDHPNVESVQVTIGAESRESVLLADTPGSNAIRAKLIELYSRLHGQTYSAGDAELEAAYTLFIESWDEVRSLSNEADYSNISWAPDLTCKSWGDYNIGLDMPTSVAATTLNYSDNGYPWYSVSEEMNEFITGKGSDPLLVKQAWVTVMVYLLSHYDYLYE